MKLAVLLLVLGLTASGRALQCFTCQSKRDMPGYQKPTDPRRDKIVLFPNCEEFDPYFPEMHRKFIQNCPAERNKTCVKRTDPNDYTNVVRECHPASKPVTSYSSYGACTDQGVCYCDTDLCNGSDRRWSSAVLLLLAVLAAVLAGGH